MVVAVAVARHVVVAVAAARHGVVVAHHVVDRFPEAHRARAVRVPLGGHDLAGDRIHVDRPVHVPLLVPGPADDLPRDHFHVDHRADHGPVPRLLVRGRWAVGVDRRHKLIGAEAHPAVLHRIDRSLAVPVPVHGRGLRRVRGGKALIGMGWQQAVVRPHLLVVSHEAGREALSVVTQLRRSALAVGVPEGRLPDEA